MSQNLPVDPRYSMIPGFNPDHFDLLDDADKRLFADSITQLVGGESLRDYVCRVCPNEPPPPHLQPIIDVIEYARIRPVRAVFDMGPGHAKTTMLLRAIAWWLAPDNSPADLCTYVTYSDQQARDKSRIAKETLLASGSDLKEDAKSAGFWLTPQGGGLLAKGSRGGITGKRVPGIAIYDDPYKDMQEARSRAINSMIIERFKTVVFTRLQGGSVLVMHTRWHVDDLIGYILKNLKWDSISIPTVCDKVDPVTKVDLIGRRIGEVAWPEKYPYDLCRHANQQLKVCGHDGHLAEIRATVGESIFAAMYQGQPRPEGTRVFHEPARFRLHDEKPGSRTDLFDNTPLRKSEFTWTGKRGVIAIDPAATASTSADHSVLLVCAMSGYGSEAMMWIIDCVRIQVEIPQLVKTARRLQNNYKLMIACEAIAGFKSVPQSLRAMDPGLRVLDVTTGGKDKYTRSMSLSSAWNSGRVLVPIDAPWADVLIAEFERFTGTNDAEDDQVDAGAHAWNTLYRERAKITEKDYDQQSTI